MGKHKPIQNELEGLGRITDEYHQLIAYISDRNMPAIRETAKSLAYSCQILADSTKERR